MELLSLQRPIDPVASDAVFHIGGVAVNNSTLAIMLLAVFALALAVLFIRKFSLVPSTAQSAFEMLYEALENFIFQITGNRNQAERLMPVVGALFFFILFSNLLGSIPALGNITAGGKALFRSPTADFNTTLSLTVGAMLVIHYFSLRDYGFWGYLGRFFKFKELFLGFRKGLMGAFMGVIDFLVGLMDIISELARVASLSLRLFGNMYAGLVLGTVIAGIFAYGLPAIFLGLGLLSAVVQAIVFTALVTVYYILALRPNE